MSAEERYHHQYAVSWGQFHRDAKLLAHRLVTKGPFKGIIAITRGGMVPATILARELEIRLVDTLCIVGYDWKQQESKCTVIKGVQDTADGEGWLVIDDLVDTGRTAEVVRNLLPKAVFATVYAKPAGKNLVDIFVQEFTQDTWVLFPWDTEVQFTPPLVSKE